MKVYLAGGMHGTWRRQIKTSRDFEEVTWFDPASHGLKEPAQYAYWDLEAIKACDLVFAYMHKDNPSGLATILEIGYALGLGKSVIFVDEKQLKYMAIAREAASFYTDNLEDGLKVLRSLLLFL